MNQSDHNRMHGRLRRWALALAPLALLSAQAHADVMPVEETVSMMAAPSLPGTATAPRTTTRPAAAALADELRAAESAAPESTVVARLARNASSSDTPSGLVFAGTAVSADRLASNRAGATTNNIDIAGTLKDATATNNVTGTNAIRDNSFANALGINTVIQNSGANVLIQNSTVVNVQFN